MGKFVCFGEIMLRLKSPGFERLMQSPTLEATFGGGEANVAVSLANFGLQASYLTALPDHDLGYACIQVLRGFGVDTSDIVLAPGRMGSYFIETGSNQRPSKVIYDRAGSVIAQLDPHAVDWSATLRDAQWLHVTGITPALSASAAQLCQNVLSEAARAGTQISCDLNYRKNLWQYGVKASEYMPKLMDYLDVCIANEEDFQNALGIQMDIGAASGQIQLDRVEALLQQVFVQYPHLKLVAMTLRESKSADHNDWSACLFDGTNLLVSKQYHMTDIVDRVGGGDSFAAGLIYGLNTFADRQDALEFAVAASCLKHSIPGDFNRVSVDEVLKLMGGNTTGRINR